MARVQGQQTFVAELTGANGAGDTPLVIEGASTQTADLFLIEKSDGTDLFKVSPDGNITVAGTSTFTGAVAGAVTFSGAVTMSTTLTVTGATVCSTSLDVDGALDVLQGSTFNGSITIADNQSIILGSTNGTKIGTATTQKLGFYNATPAVQPTAYTQTFATADKTHAARTGVAVSTTAVTQTSPFGYAGAAQGDAVATTINQIIVDLADTAGVVNALVDDLQALGLVG